MSLQTMLLTSNYAIIEIIQDADAHGKGIGNLNLNPCASVDLLSDEDECCFLLPPLSLEESLLSDEDECCFLLPPLSLEESLLSDEREANSRS
jgi:hypothetical protein